ncbi:MAG: hypothetical protein NT167_07165 [Verrucomicrobia bacterium]|nr:hypothetical protein [Verrucomicrobiota bacterium]
MLQLLGWGLSDSAISERRLVLPWALWERWLRDALRCRAHRRRHPEAFYRTWRLMALDGTQFSVSNTPQLLSQLPKASSRRGQAAFAKITTGVLLELGLHNPVAAAIGYAAQSEWQLSVQLLAQLAKGCLLLGDHSTAVQPLPRWPWTAASKSTVIFYSAPALLTKEQCGVASAMVAGWSNCRSTSAKLVASCAPSWCAKSGLG